MASNEAVIVDVPVTSAIANPAPLGLCAFALTTFVLSAANAGLFKGAEIVIGLALFYGGLAQFLAGMWEFKTGNTFGATAFTSYGAFWMAVAATLQFQATMLPSHAAFGFFLLAWTIFTAVMFIASFRTSIALIVLFGFLLITFIFLTMGEFAVFPTAQQIGGYSGLATAAIAWYTALAGLLNSVKSPLKLPIGLVTD